MRPDYINPNPKKVSRKELLEAIRKIEDEDQRKKYQAEMDRRPATMGDLRRLEERFLKN
jgi:hypothetical protein